MHLKGKKYEGFIIDIMLHFLSIMTFTLFVPTFHISINPSNFDFLDTEIFLKILFFSLFIYIILFASVSLIFHLANMKSISRFFAIFILSWVTVSGFLFPLVHSAGMVDASETIVNNTNLLIVILLSVLFSLSALTKLKYVPIVFCIIITVTSVLPSLPFAYNAFKNNKKLPQINKISTLKNIFVVSFDGIPSTVALNVLKDNQELSETFKDFVFFVNAVSQAPATHASIRSELFGNRNYHEIGRKNTEVDAKLNFNDLLINNVNDSFTYGSYNGFNLNKENRVSPLTFANIGKHEKTVQNLYWKSLILARIGTPILPNLIEKTNLYNVLKWINEENVHDGFSEKLKMYAGPGWKTSYVRQIEDYFWIVDNLTATNNDLSIRFMHFIHTHYPVDFDEDSKFRSDNLEWYLENQNYRGLYNQCIGEFYQFKKLVDKLKDLGVYDKSLIILKSDHGEPATYYDFLPNDLQINRHRLWGVDRYMPLLMIKDFSRTSDNIFYNSDLVTLGDLSKTLCNAAKIEGLNCYNYNGLNLLSDYNFSDSPYFFIETVTGPDSTHDFESHKTIALNRTEASFYEILRSSGQVYLYSQFQSALNRKLDLSESVIFNVDQNISDFFPNGWAEMDPNHSGLWTNGPKTSLKFRLQIEPSKDLLMRVKAFPYLGGRLPHQTVEVFVNSQEVAIWRMSELNWYEAIIPRKIVNENVEIKVEFNISDPTSPLEAGESTDPRKLGFLAYEIVFIEN